MRKITMALLLAFMAAPATAGEVLQALAFDRAKDGVLRVDARRGEAHQVLAEIDAPNITRPVYAVRGFLRYERVSGEAYLQLDSHFGERGTFFTKTLAEHGPMRRLSGNSDWAPFALPFFVTSGDEQGDSVMVPSALTLSIHLPDGGSVYLRDVKLLQFADNEDPLAIPYAWMDTRTAGLVGGIGGALIGLWAALIGVLASRGKGRGFAIVSANLLIGVGAASLVTGLLAVFFGQPYAVYYPFLLIGFLLVFIIGGMRRMLPQRYAAVELKKMEAMDA